MKCPNCGAEITNGKFCEYCGSQVTSDMIKEQEQVNKKCCSKCGSTNISFKREKQGEVKGKKGNRSVYKTVGVCKDCGNTWFANDTNVTGSNKSNILLWVLGWIFIFPLPLMILMLRNKKLKLWVRVTIIVIGWLLYFVIIGANKSSSSSTKASETNPMGISELSITPDSDITLKIGDKKSVNVEIEKDKSGRVDTEDINLVCSNTDAVEVSLLYTYNTREIYEISGISAGDAEIYATTADGTVTSNKLKIKVPKPVEIESIELSSEALEGCLNQKFNITVNYLPNNAEDTDLTWASSNTSIVTASSTGVITCVGEGTATVTVSAKNGVSATINVTVDGTKKLFDVVCLNTREDDVNIGDEWTYTNTINGERALKEIALRAGDTLSFYSEYTESDNNPDVGKQSVTHTVTDDEINNGFSVSYDVYVTENGGKNNGQSAHFVVTYSFSPSK